MSVDRLLDIIELFAILALAVVIGMNAKKSITTIVAIIKARRNK